MGKTPLKFIEKARIKYGPIFTISAMGSRITFVTDAEEGINLFAESTELSFPSAVQKIICCAVSLPKDIYLTNHGKVSSTIRGKLGASNMHKFTGQLIEAFQEQMEKLCTSGTKELYGLVSHLILPVTVNVLLQKGLFPTDERKIREFYQNIQTFDGGIDKAGQIPTFLLRNWAKSRKWLLDFMVENITHNKMYKSSKDDSMTLFHTLFDTQRMELNEKYFPNYGLLQLWASTTSTIPTAFWTIGFILSHPKIHKNIMEDISSVLGPAGKDKIELSEDDLKKLSLVKHCIMESTRLRGPYLTFRKVLKPLNILNYTVPAGDKLALSPLLIQRDPNNFPEPELFAPERWQKADSETQTFLDNYVAFGVGKFKCPGRWFALLEIQILIILLFYKYDCRLLDPLPKESYNSLLGIPKPEGRYRIEFKQRK